ncbi:MAG: hypothetical protein ACRDQ5_22580 [Sciscionella sp.]
MSVQLSGGLDFTAMSCLAADALPVRSPIALAPPHALSAGERCAGLVVVVVVGRPRCC